MKRHLKRLGIALLFLFGLIQFYPVTRENPPLGKGLEAPAEVAAILRRACYDCHSNETRWPWYAYIAPASWLVAHDVEEGRAELNFSIFGEYGDSKRASKASEAVEEIEEGHMPPEQYLLLHSEARITPEELEKLTAWAEGL